MINLREGAWTACSQEDAVEWCKNNKGVVVQCRPGHSGMRWDGTNMLFCDTADYPVILRNYGVTESTWRIAPWSSVKPNDSTPQSETPHTPIMPTYTTIDMMWGDYVQASQCEIGDMLLTYNPSEPTNKVNISVGGLSLDMTLEEARQLVRQLTSLTKE